MDWSELKSYASWQPIRALRCAIREVGDGIFELEDSAFVFTVPHEKNLTPSSRGPLITLAVWAESVGAARRALTGKIEMDEVVASNVPPVEMLLRPGHSTYSSLLADARESGSSSGILETASYNAQGAFIHAEIAARGFQFMFRDFRTPPNLLPYAVTFSGEMAARHKSRNM